MNITRPMRLGEVVIVCVLGLGDFGPLTRRLAGQEAAQPERSVVGRQTTAKPVRAVPERFMVRHNGCALLGPDGKEKERLDSIANGAGAISPNGLWAAFSAAEPKPPPDKRQGQLVIQSRLHADDRMIVPLIWGTTGSSFLPLWSSDSRRILICEQGFNEGRSRAFAYRVYNLDLTSLTTLKIPDEWWPSDWSADGKRLLTSLRTENGSTRVAWVPSDGSGKPEFLTSDQEVAYGARLSPDNRRALCIARPREAHDRRRERLYVIDLATNKRAVIDKPGHTHGFCWSSDGLKVAYTWQMPLREPDEAVERKTYLITSDPDGGNQKNITMRSYKVAPNNSGRGDVIYFFEVLAWWR